MEEKEKNLFDVITGYSVNEGLDEALQQNEEYIKIQKKIEEREEQLDRQNFTKEQRQMIDKLVCAHIEIAAYIGDLESTTEKYYIAVRKKIMEDGEAKHVVMLPPSMKASKL